MKSRPLWRLSVFSRPEAEEAIVQLMENLFSVIPASYTNAATGRTIITLYCDKRDALHANRPRLESALKRLAATGLPIGSGRITMTRLRQENWAESWKRHFKPLEIGRRLLIKPSWSRRHPRPLQATVVLDPGLSFGTGHHATTEFCLRQIVLRRHLGAQALLDIGTGSGILAIAAVKLGYKPVHAFDFDPDAVRVARSNARKNGVTRVRFTRNDVTNIPLQCLYRYDTVCANLTSNLLISERNRIANRVLPAGALVLAGILKSEFDEVERVYEDAGMNLIASRSQKEWRSGTFKFA